MGPVTNEIVSEFDRAKYYEYSAEHYRLQCVDAAEYNLNEVKDQLLMGNELWRAFGKMGYQTLI